MKNASPDFSLSPSDAMVCSGLDTSESTLFFGSLCTRFKFFDGVLFFFTLENKDQSILKRLNENETQVGDNINDYKFPTHIVTDFLF